MPMFPYWYIKDEDILPAIKAKKSVIIDEILTLLAHSGKLPTFKIGNQFGVHGEYDPRLDSIELNRWSGNSVATMAHELTHALSSRMTNSAVNWKYNPLSPEQSQFSDAAFKLDSAPKFKTGYAYRDHPEEAAAFGVGNHIDVPVQQPWEESTRGYGVPHMDATNATEQAILRDLYAKALKSKKSP